MTTQLLAIYCDGCCFNNGQVGAHAGIGVHFPHNPALDLAEPLVGERQTNQRAELMAAIRALETIGVEANVMIYTDSKYTISSCTEWMPVLNALPAPRNPKSYSNLDLMQHLYHTIQARTGMTTFEYVPAHVGIVGNERADELAKQGAKKKK